MQSILRNLMRRTRRYGPEAGLTIMECIVAAALLLVAISGILVPFQLVISQNKNQGELATRAAEYGRDKMEQLLALSYNDATTDTTQVPPSAAGTGLGGQMAPNSTVGSISRAAPVVDYFDYLDENGNHVTGPTCNYTDTTFCGLSLSTLEAVPRGAVFERMWSIATDSTGQTKTISVSTTVLSTALQENPPATLLVCLKSSYQ